MTEFFKKAVIYNLLYTHITLDTLKTPPSQAMQSMLSSAIHQNNPNQQTLLWMIPDI